jgi:hypothetical protein
MIDLTNKPEGATRKSTVSEHTWLKRSGDQVMVNHQGIWVPFANDNEAARHWNSADTISDQWAIYSNTLPLSELSDEQAAELFNYARHGGIREATYGHANIDVSNHTWFPDAIYRAKQKTEREMFIDAATLATKTKQLSANELCFVEELFDADFKAPKGE